MDTEAGTAWSVLRGWATLVKSPSEAELAAAGHPLVASPGRMILVRPARRDYRAPFRDTSTFWGPRTWSSEAP